MKRLSKEIVFKVLGKIYHDRISKVLYLHDVYLGESYAKNNPCTEIGRFQEMVEVIRGCGFDFVKEFTDKRNQIKLCFDDGFRGIWDNREVFFTERIYPTVFIIKSFVGQEGYLTENEIKELASHYGFVFQSHTVGHISITDPKVSEEQLRFELSESKKYLEDLLKCNVDSICLPRGYFSIEKLKVVKQYYKKIYSSIPGSVCSRLKYGMIARNLIQGLTDEELKATIYGAQTLLAPYYSAKLRK